jgi:hypothetical protein
MGNFENIQPKYIESFLERNGFKNIKGVFSNKHCEIKIHPDHYEIMFFSIDLNDYVSLYTESINIPKLIGHLVWYDLIDRNFTK